MLILEALWVSEASMAAVDDKTLGCTLLTVFVLDFHHVHDLDDFDNGTFENA